MQNLEVCLWGFLKVKRPI